MIISYKSIYKHWWVMALCYMLFFKPSFLDYYDSLASLNRIINIIKLISATLIILGYVTDRKFNVHYRNVFTSIGLFFAWIVFVTYLGHESVQHVILNCLYAFSFSLFISDGFLINRRGIIKSAVFVLAMWEIIHLLVYQIYPDGIVRSAYYANKIHFLGAKNSISGYVIPLCILSFLARKSGYYSRLLHVFVLLISIITIVLSKSSTGILSVVLLIVFCLLVGTNRKKLYKYRFYILGAFALSIGVVFFRIQNYFGFLIEDIFGKSVDLTNRTMIWDTAIKQIGQHPIIGTGMNTNTGTILIGNTLYYSHNLILEILISSGIIGLILYLNIYRCSLRSLVASIRVNNDLKIDFIYEKVVAVIGLLAFLVTAIAEAPVFKLYFFLCIVLLNRQTDYKQ